MSLPGWSQAHSNEVRKRIEAISQSQKPQTIGEELRWEAATTFGLLQCYSDLGGAAAISPSGDMFSMNEDTNWQPEPLLEEDQWYWIALAKLTELFEFNDLRPVAPAGSMRCSECGGLGKFFVGIGELGCGACLGYGWTAQDGMVPALMREARARRKPSWIRNILLDEKKTSAKKFGNIVAQGKGYCIKEVTNGSGVVIGYAVIGPDGKLVRDDLTRDAADKLFSHLGGCK